MCFFWGFSICCFLTKLLYSFWNLYIDNNLPDVLIFHAKCFLIKFFFITTVLYSVHIVYIRVEWFSTFYDFWKPIHFCSSGIFLGTQFPKIGNFAHALAARVSYTVYERQSFHFQKITGTLKINIFMWNFAKTFLIHQRTIAKNKIRS